jgi:hypothetical protein
LRRVGLLVVLGLALLPAAGEVPATGSPVPRPVSGAMSGAASEPEVGPVPAAGAPLPRPEPAGPVCDADAVVGVRLPEIAGPGGCGVAAPVEVRFAAGVALDPPAVVSCGAARALAAWLTTDVKPILAARGERLLGLDIAAAYACRGRNNQPGAKLSEHGLGRAVDVAGFRLRERSGDEGRITVEPGAAPLIPTTRAAACGPFATVLGPGSDAFHEDHLHLDVAERRHGPYCR